MEVADLWMVVALASLVSLTTSEEEAALRRVRAALAKADELGAS